MRMAGMSDNEDMDFPQPAMRGPVRGARPAPAANPDMDDDGWVPCSLSCPCPVLPADVQTQDNAEASLHVCNPAISVNAESKRGIIHVAFEEANPAAIWSYVRGNMATIVMY